MHNSSFFHYHGNLLTSMKTMCAHRSTSKQWCAAGSARVMRLACARVCVCGGTGRVTVCVCVCVKDRGDTALHIAARQHSTDMAKLLAEHNADVDKQNVRYYCFY